MDYLSVTQSAFFSASFVTLLLALIVTVQSFKSPWKALLLFGLIAQFIWLTTLLTSYTLNSFNTDWIFRADWLHFIGWFISLSLLLFRREHFSHWPTTIKITFSIGLFVATASCLVLFAPQYFSPQTVSATLLGFAVISLIFTELVTRNLNKHRFIKLFGLCLALLFAFDVLVYGYHLINGSTPALLWQARAAVALAFGLLLALGAIVLRHDNQAQSLFSVSRPVVFYTTSTLLSVAVIGIVAIGKFYTDNVGYLGSFIYILLAIFSLVVLFALLLSAEFRQSFDVFISKHFFSLKYDYRQEWLFAIKQLSNVDPSDSKDYYQHMLQVLCTAMRAKRGSIWIRNGSTISEHYSNLPHNLSGREVKVHEPFIKQMLAEHWIYVPNGRGSQLTENNDLLPGWIYEIDNLWLITPLIVQMKLVGFAFIEKPSNNQEVTYEDRDLMTNLSSQVASHILIHQQEQTIIDAKQLEAYNRLSAFIMHDVNNVITQLAFISKNAERHKSNPAFIDDMLKTVDNAVGRMRNLVQKFHPQQSSTIQRISVADVVKDAIELCSDRTPVPELKLEQQAFVNAHRDKLLLTVKNLIRNAQDASHSEGTITLTVRSGSLSIEDNGQGMNADFVNQELFRPFRSTKNENGMGIGAHLSKTYIESIGGALTVQSTPNVGTIFTAHFAEA